MAYKEFDDYTADYSENSNQSETQSITLDGLSQTRVELPDATFVRDAEMSRDGFNLVLQTDEGSVIIENYFASEPPPHLTAPDGTALTADLVNSFLSSGNQYADAGITANDASPVGAVQEISGQATVTRVDGTTETVGLGTPIYQGDVIETDQSGAVNITFIDETTFAVSEDARLAIDEYVFDPATQSGTTNFSVLKGVFVFTSGLIGRDDPDDVMIDTPSGSIGIRGTIIAGDVNTGEITVIEGAIVLHDHNGNSITLADQYETARFNPTESTIDHMGNLGAEDVSAKFMSVSTVAADLFSSIQDSAAETGQDNTETTSSETSSTQTENQDDASTKENEGTTEQEAQQQTESNDSTPEQQTQEDSQESSAEQQTAPEEIITSDDITADSKTSTEGTTSTGTEGPLSSGTTTNTSNGTTTTSGGATSTKLGEQPEIQPFQIDVSKAAFAENVAGATVARVTGHFTTLTNVNLLGPSQNHYEIVRETPNSLAIKLKPGVSLDAEDPYGLFIQASNDLGTRTIKKTIDLSHVANDDEALTYDMPSTTDMFVGSNNSEFAYDFSQDFNDPEGITSYNFAITDSSSQIYSGSLYEGNSSGILKFDLIGSATNSSITIDVTANSATDTDTQTYTFFSKDADDVTTATSLGLSNKIYVYEGDSSTVTVSGSSNYIFADMNDVNHNFVINTTGTTLRTGRGNDSVTITLQDNNVFAGADHDTFTLNATDMSNNVLYGQGGHDLYKVDISNVISSLQSGATGVDIDGGVGFDTFKLANTGLGDIDFTVITDSFIKNIEKISTQNGDANTIDLSYTDVVNMTDQGDRLFIDMDSSDTVNFTGSPNQFFKVGQVDQDGETYNTYTDGNITLLIDADEGAVNGVV